MSNRNRAPGWKEERRLGVQRLSLHFITSVLLVQALGCATAPPRAATAASVLVSGAKPSSAASAPPSSDPATGARPLPEAVSALAAEGVSGAIALYDSRDGTLYCSDPTRCSRPYLAAATAQIPLTAIALETAQATDAESPLPWDGKPSENADWNQNHTLRSAERVSCEPCFRAIARKVGDGPLREWFTRLAYGNGDTAQPNAAFSLETLRITPLQQIDFLRRLDGVKLSIQEHSLDVVRDVLTLDVGPEYVLRGKTAWREQAAEPRALGWFVGFVELGERRVFFATVLDAHAPGVDMQPIPRRVTERVLRARDELPSQSP